MRTRRLLLTVVGVIGLGLLGLVSLGRREREELRRQTVAVLKQKVGLEMELRRAAQAADARAAAKIATPTTSPAAETKAPSPVPRPILRSPSLVDLARDNPGLWNEFIGAKKAELAQRYGPLFQSLGLLPEQREQFKVIMSAETARSADITAAADAQQLQRDDPILVALRKQSVEQRQAELAVLLGARGHAEFNEFERTIQVRGLADGLAVQLAAVEPLSGQQADRLTRVFASSSAAFLRGGSATSADMDWASIDEQTRAILTPTQFAIWERGTAHNRYGGSRRDVELKKLYEQTVGATKSSDGGTAGGK